MLKINLFCAITIAILINIPSVYGQSPQAETDTWKISTTQFVVGASEATMPQGFFLLIRKGKKIGAVRFTDIEKGNGLCIGKANYESYFQDDGSFLFGTPNIRKHTGKINIKPLKGIGRLSFQFGKYKVKIGEWTFDSGCPGILDMYPSGRDEKDYGYEFAPTSAQNINEIDALDKKLKWFRFNAEERIKLLVSELPK